MPGTRSGKGRLDLEAKFGGKLPKELPFNFPRTLLRFRGNDEERRYTPDLEQPSRVHLPPLLRGLALSRFSHQRQANLRP